MIQDVQKNPDSVLKLTLLVHNIEAFFLEIIH